MKLILTLLAVTTLLKGSQFPEISGKNLNGKQVSIPSDSNDKITLVGMAYSKKSEGALKSWFMPVYDKFILKRGMFDSNYDVNVFFIPMFTGLKKSAYESTYKKLKESNRDNLFDHILFYKGGLEPYKSELGLKEKETPYLFLIDQSGNIIHKASGKFTEGKMEKIEDVLDNL